MFDATLRKQKMLDKTKRTATKLKDKETNVIQVFDVRGHKEIFVKTKRSAIKLKDEEAKVIQA